MKRKNEQTIGEVIGEMIKAYGLEKRLKQAEIGQVWNQLLGPSVAKSTQRVTLSNGIVTVYLDSGLVKHELNMMRSRLVTALNEAMGSQVVKDVILR
jgi:predicted nucleic acid-binding Zn ribbon protein